jgi:hypothetical protein
LAIGLHDIIASGKTYCDSYCQTKILRYIDISIILPSPTLTAMDLFTCSSGQMPQTGIPVSLAQRRGLGLKHYFLSVS